MERQKKFLFGASNSGDFPVSGILLQNRPGGVNDILLPKGSPFFSGGPHLPTRFTLPAARERCLSMPETGEKERNY